MDFNGLEWVSMDSYTFSFILREFKATLKLSECGLRSRCGRGLWQC